MKRFFWLVFTAVFAFGLIAPNPPTARNRQIPTATSLPTSTLSPVLEPLLRQFQLSYRSPLEMILGLTNDYGFTYDLGFWKDYPQILGGDNSLANILRHGVGVCQQFAELAAVGMEGKGYQFGIMVLSSDNSSGQAANADHEIMAFRDQNGLWGYTSNEQYVAPQFHSLNELFYRSWSQNYRSYSYRDSKDFPPNWESNQNLLFQARAVVGPFSPAPKCTVATGLVNPAPRVQIVDALSSETGSVDSFGEVLGSALVGDPEPGRPAQAFVTFSLPVLADDTEIAASVEFLDPARTDDRVSVTGDPFGKFGCLKVYLDDFDRLGVENYTRSTPLGAVRRICKLEDLKPTLAADWAAIFPLRKDPGRLQLRFQFERGTAPDPTADYLDLTDLVAKLDIQQKADPAACGNP